MDEKPEKTCTIDRLVTQPKLVEAVKEGKKSQQRRDGVYGWPGEMFDLDGMVFVITGLHRQRLGDMTDDDALAEGYPNFETYKEIILKMHSGMNWNVESQVWVHSFSAKTPC